MPYSVQKYVVFCLVFVRELNTDNVDISPYSHLNQSNNNEYQHNFQTPLHNFQDQLTEGSNGLSGLSGPGK